MATSFSLADGGTIGSGNAKWTFDDSNDDISTTAKIGIGTEAPDFPLDVKPVTATARIGRVELGGWPHHTDYALFGHSSLDHSVVGNYAILQDINGKTHINSSSSQPIAFRINNGTDDVMHIASSGNVGIGTTSPQGQLHISSGTSGDCAVIIQADTDNNNELDNPYIVLCKMGHLKKVL